jgi:hypothetical protein
MRRLEPSFAKVGTTWSHEPLREDGSTVPGGPTACLPAGRPTANWTGVMSHQHHTFHNPPSATPAVVRAALDRRDIRGALDAMVGCALHGEGDWREAQELYLSLLDHPDHQVQALAATCLGHLARVCRRLDEDRVIAALKGAAVQPHVRATAANALDDIATFLHPRRIRWHSRLRRLRRPWTPR